MKTIKIILGGSEGKMGNILKKLISEEEDMEIVYKIDPKTACYPSVEDLIKDTKSLKGKVDVYVDFTEPSAVLDNVQKISEQGIDSEVGTTGWYDKMDEMEEIAKSNKTRILYARNFAIGVNMLCYLKEKVAEILGKFGYDCHEFEVIGAKGSVTGYNKIIFSPTKSDYERLTISHNAFNQEVFGHGALEGIRWLYNHKDLEPGVYTFKEDVLGLK